MKLKDLIKKLKKLEKEYSGDLPVVLSSDEEGNSYGTLSEDWSFGEGTNRDDKPICLVLYPYESNFDYYEEAARKG